MPKQNQCILCSAWFDRNSPTQKRCNDCRERINLIPKRKYTFNRYIDKICEFCNNPYIAKEFKSKFCAECVKEIEYMCQCGCNRHGKAKFWKARTSPFIQGHHSKGKTYMEIYGTDTPKCGFGKGKDNPMANVDLVRKLFSSIKKKDVIYDGYKFSNKYELNTYKYLRRKFEFNNIRYEQILKVQGRLYLPDFLIYDKEGNILEMYEVSGFASVYEASRIRNLNKLKDIRNEYPNLKITFISDQKLLNKYNFDFNIITETYENILRCIQ